MLRNSPLNFLRYLVHYFNARSKFDLHSPFVYTLYSKVLKDQQEYPGYQKLVKQYPGIKQKKYYRLLYRISLWFKPKNICFIGREQSAEKEYLRSGFPAGRIFLKPDEQAELFDLVFVDLQSLKEPVEKCFSSLQQHLSNGSVFIIWSLKDPMKLKTTRNLIQTLPGITVTIDLFYLRLIFVNPDLSREDFRIRF